MLTACGIETEIGNRILRVVLWLQQCLPLAVLKQSYCKDIVLQKEDGLQQCLPLAVLKPEFIKKIEEIIETGCNSAYRLRY